MSFWRSEVIDFALDHETRRHMEEQRRGSRANPPIRVPTTTWRSSTA